MWSTFETLPTSKEALKESDAIVRKLVKQCELTDQKFTDPEFPPNDKSIGKIKVDQGQVSLLGKEKIWLRPENIGTWNGLDAKISWRMWRNQCHSSEVLQGMVGNCWLISTLKALAGREEFLKQIVPRKKDFSKHGIFRVRLFVDGEWKIIIVDDWFPCVKDKNRLLYGSTARKQLFVSVIEKAFAKLKGDYEKLAGGFEKMALEKLTGVNCRYYKIPKLSQDDVWEALSSSTAAGFLITVSTGKNEECTKMGLMDSHCYTVLKASVQHGHRLIQIDNCCPNTLSGWKGKWSVWASWSKEVVFLMTWLGLWNCGLFWMELDDFCKWFDLLTVCPYREGWHEVRFKESRSFLDTRHIKLIRVLIDQPCQMVIEVSDVEAEEKGWVRVLFLNVHRVTEAGRIGECVHSTSVRGNSVETDSFELQPGEYFVVYSEHRSIDGLYRSCDLVWVIQSNKPFQHEVDELYTDFYTTSQESWQQMVLKEGKIRDTGDEKTVIRSYINDHITILMAENHRTDLDLAVKCEIPDYKHILMTGGVKGKFCRVLPMSRRIVVWAVKRYSAVGDPVTDINVEWKLHKNSSFWNAFDFWNSSIPL